LKLFYCSSVQQSMAGGLMQLVAYGAQDVYISSNPQITFFKIVYRRHTNFALEAIEQTFNGAVDFGRKVSATISRNGDLIHRMYLQVDLPVLTGSATQRWVDYIGETMIKEVEIEIGGARIDRHYGQFLHIWGELTLTKAQEETYKTMVGQTSTNTTAAASIPANTLYVPLQFWFCRNAGLALPLIALQYHEIKVNLEFRPASECYTTPDASTVTTPVISSASLFCDYVYLDTDERRQFAQVAHEYLIEQVQFTGSEAFSASSVRQKLNFNHPVKELIWVSQLDTVATANDHTNFSSGGANHLVDAKLLLNGQDRFSTRKAGYFNLVQPFQHHTRGPATGIYVYSFALKPEDHQPSGSVNMSRIDNATMQLSFASSAAIKVYTYAISYNVFRVMSGMGGLAYSS
jgi:hypothetical protein